ncbi:hypothetical protein B0J11DRAFT_503185 [Dendryphion nanum]|uniref:Secreted protein n=1 Tax=Dendryphion nanum TaxID=256645 RepID=A0A9P9E5Y5_9PLEO|nr:hypothetical protein B0J11DRAFT_503185 [Dendryphion nanum]
MCVRGEIHRLLASALSLSFVCVCVSQCGNRSTQTRFGLWMIADAGRPGCVMVIAPPLPADDGRSYGRPLVCVRFLLVVAMNCCEYGIRWIYKKEKKGSPTDRIDYDR